MGEVKDTVKGSPPEKRKKSMKSDDNLVNQIQTLRDEVSDLITIKDDDAAKEGKDAYAENVRKAASLRAVHSLLTSTQRLLEDYDA